MCHPTKKSNVTPDITAACIPGHLPFNNSSNSSEIQSVQYVFSMEML